MAPLDVPAEFKSEVDKYNAQIKSSIFSHQMVYKKYLEEPTNLELQKSLKEWETKIYNIGMEGRKIFGRLRKEYKVCQKNGKKTMIRNGIEERRANVNNSLGRARKQNIIARPTSLPSSSSEGSPSGVSSPEPIVCPIVPSDLSKEQFLRNFNLFTHATVTDMTNRRVERKRRSTTNPLYVYTKEWNATTIPANTKKKRNSPPRPVGRRKARDVVAKRVKSRSPSPSDKETTSPPLVGIPNLPSGLTIERVSPSKQGDVSKCVECSLPGNLQECENCKNGFHVSCHNRILSQAPKHCPKCHALKEKGGSGMSVTCVTTDKADKLQEKKMLLERNRNLTAELTQLQDKHSQLTISLRNQKTQREELLTSHQSTEEKIKKIFNFITSVKEPGCEQKSPESDS